MMHGPINIRLISILYLNFCVLLLFLHLSLFFDSHISFLISFTFLKSFYPSKCPVPLFSKIRPPAHCQLTPSPLKTDTNSLCPLWHDINPPPICCRQCNALLYPTTTLISVRKTTNKTNGCLNPGRTHFAKRYAAIPAVPRGDLNRVSQRNSIVCYSFRM